MPSAKLFFYFNGFNAAILDDYSGNAKIVAVAEFAAARHYRFRPVSIAYRRAPEHCLEILSEIRGDEEAVVFCGSSMGGWFARILQLKLHQQWPGLRSAAVAFNPAFDLGEHGHMLLGEQTNFVTGEEYTWTAEHSAALAKLEAGVDYDLPLPFFVYIDRDDEVISSRHSTHRHAAIAHLKLFEGGCHSFDHARPALADFGTLFLK